MSRPRPIPLFALASALALYAQAPPSPPSFQVLTHRMDVDVDGAPNAYGPPGSPTLDKLRDAHYLGHRHSEIVGYLTDDDHPNLKRED